MPRSLFGRIFLHILFWICVILFYTFVYGRMAGNYYISFLHIIITLPVYLATTYFTLYYVIPKFLFHKDYKSVIVSAVYMVLGSAYYEIMINIYLFIIPTTLWPFSDIQPINTSTLDIYLRLIGIFIVVFFTAFIKLLKHWYTSQNMNQQLAQQKLEAELNFLKSQVHPHFLFNTLNNLYALTLKKSEKSPEVVLKLSEILDYMLYECNTEKILLKKEIKLIENYIALEQLRHGKRLRVDFEINGNISDNKIAPLILFPFVENSIKHGVSKKTGESWIKIDLNTERGNLSFVIANSKPVKTSANHSERGEGIGLKNVKQRLKILYGDNYSMEIRDEENVFTVLLEIDLTEQMSEDSNEN